MAVEQGATLSAVEHGTTLPAGSPRAYRFWTHCGIEWLGPFNRTEWRAETPLARDEPDVPESWDHHTDESENVVLRIELLDLRRIIARPADGNDAVRAAYVPANGPAPGCD